VSLSKNQLISFVTVELQNISIQENIHLFQIGFENTHSYILFTMIIQLCSVIAVNKMEGLAGNSNPLYKVYDS
jgi:hypothetical protein